MSSHPHFLWADLFRSRRAESRLVPEALKENILFSTLNPRELSFLSSIVYERVYEPGEPVFRQNDRGFGMYVIARGTIAIKTLLTGGVKRTRASQEAEPPKETELLVTKLTKGSFFGELSLLEIDNIRSASAIAAERTVLIGFFKPDLKEILDRKPQMGVKILLQLSSVLGKRLLETTDRLTQMAPQVTVLAQAKRAHEDVA